MPPTSINDSFVSDWAMIITIIKLAQLLGNIIEHCKLFLVD